MKTILVRKEPVNFNRSIRLIRLVSGAACVSLMVSTAAAEADEPGGRGERGLRESKQGRHHHQRMEEIWKRLDRDGDARISKEEFFAMPRLAQLPEEKRERLFARLDADADGSLSPKEVGEMRREGEKRGWENLRQLDTDGSGGVSFEEFGKSDFFQKLPDDRRKQIFDRMDSDEDGQITAQDRPKGPPHRKRE